MAKDIRVSLELDSKQFDKGIKKSKQEVTGLGTTANKTSGILRTLAGAFAVREIIQFGDSITNLKNKLLTLNPSADAVARQFDRIREIAISSRSDLDGVGDLYFRIARAQDELGITSEETASIVESVSKAITASGLSAQEAQGPLLQLGQALQSGRFQGDELRSILEGLPDVARALARTLNVPIGKLKDLGSQGLITGDIFVRAMKEAKTSIDDAFANTDVTIGQGFSVVQTSFAGLVESVGESTGVFDSIAQSLVTLADFVERLSKSGEAIKSFGASILSVIGIFLLFGKAVPAAGRAIDNLRTGTLTSSKAFKSFSDINKGLGTSVKNAAMRLVGLKEVGNSALTPFGRLSLVFNGLIRLVAGPVGLTLAIYGLFKAIKGIQDLKAEDAIQKIIGEGAEATVKKIKDLQEEIKGLEESNTKMVTTFSKTGKLTISYEKDVKEIERLTGVIDKLFESLSMEDRAEFLGMEGLPDDHPIMVTKREAEEAAKAAAKLQTEITNFMLGLGKAERSPEKFNEAITRLNELMGDPKTNEEFLEYEKNLNSIYRLFGESKPIAKPFEELNEEVAKVEGLQQYKNVVEQIKEQLKLMGISSTEAEILLGTLNEKISKSEQIFFTFQDAVDSAGMALGDDLANALVEGESALDSFQNFFKDVVKQVIAEAIRLTVVRALISSIFGAFGYGVTFGASSDIASISKKIPGKAMGGPVMANKPYIVGEKGPELMIPGSSGTIVPNHAMGGATTVNYNIQAIDSASFQQRIAQDPQFLHAVVTKGANDLPSGRRF
jgi:tape measure domain-containing protein